jgi:hypothetical protein
MRKSQAGSSEARRIEYRRLTQWCENEIRGPRQTIGSKAMDAKTAAAKLKVENEGTLRSRERTKKKEGNK